MSSGVRRGRRDAGVSSRRHGGSTSAGAENTEPVSGLQTSCAPSSVLPAVEIRSRTRTSRRCSSISSRPNRRPSAPASRSCARRRRKS
jgi:hypothetical protein